MDLTDYELRDLGEKAKVLIDLHFENPEKFSKEKVFDLIADEYEKIVCRKHG